MSTTTVSTERRICDMCKVNETYQRNACVVCGKDYCWQCADALAVRYHAGVHIQGHGDVTYCHECDEKSKGDPKREAYARIKNLRYELIEWSAGFEVRRKTAEEAVKAYIK